jgi:hypothetical protein
LHGYLFPFVRKEPLAKIVNVKGEKAKTTLGKRN